MDIRSACMTGWDNGGVTVLLKWAIALRCHKSFLTEVKFIATQGGTEKWFPEEPGLKPGSDLSLGALQTLGVKTQFCRSNECAILWR